MEGGALETRHPVKQKKPSTERTNTDASLRAERTQADAALVKRLAAVEEEADQVLQQARDTADAVLVVARDKADLEVTVAVGGLEPRAALERARMLEDEVLREERSKADEILRRERDAEIRALAKLLPLEREKTDTYLHYERVRADGNLSQRDDFLGIVAHDLRNLLGGIVMSAALLGDAAEEDEKGQKIRLGTERIKRSSARMNRLIGDLLDVVSLDAGRLAITPTPGDLVEVVTEALETFKATALAKRITLETEMVDPLVAVFDHNRILQVLANLLTNAIKFTPEGGRITLRAERVGDELRCSVSDTGVGIAAGMLEVIFERFRQLAAGDRTLGPGPGLGLGLGLGLYISRSIITAHAGTIWAESTVGEGSRLSFTIPSPAVSLETTLRGRDLHSRPSD
jgi:signal transduction histidine kinase